MKYSCVRRVHTIFWGGDATKGTPTHMYAHRCCCSPASLLVNNRLNFAEVNHAEFLMMQLQGVLVGRVHGSKQCRGLGSSCEGCCH